MKPVIFILILLLIVFVVPGVKAQTPDYTARVNAVSYTDSLKSTNYPVTNGTMRDSVAVSFNIVSNFGYYEITAYSTSADTLFCDVLGYDEVTYARRCLINLGEPVLITSRVNKMITGTTPLSFVVLGGVQVPKFLFTSVGANTIYFTVVGKRGVPYY
jgi:hypothetical protein